MKPYATPSNLNGIRLLFGKKNKFEFDVGYYYLGTEGSSASLLTFGIGGKFKFGDFETSSRCNKRSRR